MIEKRQILRQFGRRVRLGMVGGGEGSVIGETHMLAMRADGLCELVAGALSSRPAVARRSAEQQLIAADRIYHDYQVMAREEAARPDRIDAVVIATPPDSHLQIATAFLEQGFDVICEKPLTSNLHDAVTLASLAKRSGRLFCLTHCYTGYPMVRQARELVAAGAVGKPRMIEAEFALGGPGMASTPDNGKEQHWRFRPDVLGRAGILTEVNSHAYNLATYIGGVKAEQVSALLSTFVPGRAVYDNAYLTVRFSNNVQGRLWSSYAASGNNLGQHFRIFGDEGSLSWNPEQPETLVLSLIGRPAEILTRGQPGLDTSISASRFGTGFPEGYGLGFANLYVDFALAVMARELGLPGSRFTSELPDADDGLEGMRFAEAAVLSSAADGRWIRVERPQPNGGG